MPTNTIAPRRSFTVEQTHRSTINLSRGSSANGYDEQIAWERYKANKGTQASEKYLDRLIELHGFIIHFWAKEFAQRNRNLWEMEDAEQYARIAAIHAYDTYDPARRTKLKSWVYSKIHNALFDHEETDGLIKCPGRKATLRAYLAGRYDTKPERKAAIEEEYAIHSTEDIERLKSNLASLFGVAYAEDLVRNETRPDLDSSEIWQGTLDHSQLENEIITVIDINNATSLLTDKQREVISLVVLEQLSLNEVAERTQNSVSGVKALLHNARKKLRRAADADDINV